MFTLGAPRPNTRWLLIRAALVLSMAGWLFYPCAFPSHAANPPQPLSPADQTQTSSQNYPPLGIPSFEWSQVPGASLYRIEVSQNLEFSPLVLSVSTPYTRYTPILEPEAAWADGQYYWRVRVETPESAFSAPFRFTKTWATESTPILLAPQDGQMLSFLDAPAFSWMPVTGAAQYRLQIAAGAASFNTPLYEAHLLATSHQPSIRLPNQTYAWRVVPLDAAGYAGEPSATRTFSLSYGTTASDQVPLQLEPAENSHPLFTPTFAWTAVAGAEKYTLQYTSSPTCNFDQGESISTLQTSYTPITAFPSNAAYCWRVRAQSSEVIGEWSTIGHFQRQWSIAPTLLTPPNESGPWAHPLYAWTAVPQAAYYHIEIALDRQFTQMFDQGDTANLYYTPGTYLGITPATYYWRVTPYNDASQPGQTSETYSWESHYASAAPALIYPPYYAAPNENLNPSQDRTAAYPIFLWQRVYNPWPHGDLFADAYRLEVATNPNFSTSTVWQYDTENTSATPTLLEAFSPLPNQDYFWRVCPLEAIGSDCLANPETSTPWWSQTWQARFDAALASPPTSGAAPELLRPEHGQEIVEATPLLEWLPFEGAEHYQIQISRDPDFDPASTAVEAEVNIPAYAPPNSLAQRSLGRTDYGTFYWRVRACTAETCTGWSTARRFQIASQSEWRAYRQIGLPFNRLLIGEDPIDAAASSYELSTLYASQAVDTWYFGFEATLSTPNTTYGLLLDLDHLDGSGASLPPATRPYSVTAINAHLPEYAIFIDQISGTVSAHDAWIFAWDGQAWNAGQRLDSTGGNLFYASGYLEIEVLSSMIGMSASARSISIILFSVDGAGQAQDSAPSDPQAPGSGILSRFSAVSEHLNLRYPPDTGGGDPASFAFVPPFFWDYSTGGDPSSFGDPHPPSPWAGITLEVHRYPDYSYPVASVDLVSNVAYYALPSAALPTDLDGDGLYSWRVRPYYWDESLFSGAWTEGAQFQRGGLSPQNLHTSVDYTTPAFSWDMAEGAASYTLQISTDPNFNNTPIVETSSINNRFTPSLSLPDGEYYWRVRANRYGGVADAWSAVANFSLQRPAPAGLTSIPQPGFSGAPTLCWEHLLAPAEGLPILSAWMYRVEISREPDFDPLYESPASTPNACFTPSQGYADGVYYWRVAMIDGGGNFGPFSQVQSFTKSYPPPTSPGPIGSVLAPPTFSWSAQSGASAYRWEIASSEAFWPLVDWATTINISLTPPTALPENTMYSWRVAVIDDNGILGPFSQAQIFLHSPPVDLRAYLPQVYK